MLFDFFIYLSTPNTNILKYKVTTYRTLTGTKDILELPTKKTGQWIVYQNNKPEYHVDCFDFKKESNLKLNNLILSEQKTISEVVRNIRKKKKINLSLPTVPILKIMVKTGYQDFDLKPFPEEWLS